MVKNLTTGSMGSYIPWMVDLNGILFFTLFDNDGSHYTSTIYKTDGTSAGTTLVKTFPKDYNGSNTKIGYLLGANKTHVFYADHNISGFVEIWKTNGTTVNNGTVIVSASSQKFYTVGTMRFLGGKMYFNANPYNEYYNVEPWVTDGTPAGTMLLKDINTTKDEDNRNQSSRPLFYTEVNGNVLFVADDDSLFGLEVWKTNGKAGGTAMLKNIAPSYLDARVSPYDFNAVSYKGAAYFIADDKVHGIEIWKTDGTTAGTKLFIDTDPGIEAGTGSGITSMAYYKGKLYFGADEGLFGKELWSSDGTDTGTHMLKNISPLLPIFGEEGSEPDNFAEVNNQLLFSAATIQTGTELYRTDGTAAGTGLVKDIWNGMIGSTPKELTPLNGQVYFYADGDSPGEELFKSNGSAAGTLLVKDIYPTSYASQPRNLFNANRFLLFSAEDGKNGRELWVSGGIAGNTTMLKDIYPGSSGSDPYAFANLDSVTCFLNRVHQLWVTDGTTAGTKMLKQFNTVSGTLTRAGNLLYFAADGGSGSGKELWATDGTAAGTFEVMDIAPGTAYSDPLSMTAMDDRIYFSAFVSGDRELWRSDGTKAGTFLVKDINSSGSSTPLELTRINRRIYFSALSSAGRELWETDGTTAGTTMVMDIRPGPLGSDPQTLYNAEGILYFTADDSTHGRELWKYNSGCNSYSTVLSPQNSAWICTSGGLTITAHGSMAGASNFKWLRNDTMLSVTGTSILATVPGKYRAVSENGSCSDTSDVLLVQMDIPLKVSIKPKTSFNFCTGSYIDLDVVSNDTVGTIAWFLNGKVLANQVKRTLRVSNPGSITVRITNQYGCIVTSAPVTIGINPNPVVNIQQNGNTLRATPGFKHYQWYKGSAAINGKTADTLVPTTVGIYKVLATNDSGCTAYSNSINFQFSGIEDFTQSSISLYPNPATGKVLIQAEELLPGSRIRIYDGCGKLLHEANASGKQVVLDVSGYSNGILFIELISGERVMRAKLLKQ
jgi:ELWxxDGT repeat protein